MKLSLFWKIPEYVFGYVGLGFLLLAIGFFLIADCFSPTKDFTWYNPD